MNKVERRRIYIHYRISDAGMMMMMMLMMLKYNAVMISHERNETNEDESEIIKDETLTRSSENDKFWVGKRGGEGRRLCGPFARTAQRKGGHGSMRERRTPMHVPITCNKSAGQQNVAGFGFRSDEATDAQTRMD